MKIEEIPYNERLKEAAAQLSKGVFLTVKSPEATNVMTIGWCMFGIMWNRPVCQVMIGTSRFTYGLLESGVDFTLSFPLDNNMGGQLAFCGSKSGRDLNKTVSCGIELAPAQKTASPVVAGCSLYYECKIIAKQRLPVERVSQKDELHEKGSNNYHMVYYGEITACYFSKS